MAATLGHHHWIRHATDQSADRHGVTVRAPVHARPVCRIVQDPRHEQGPGLVDRGLLMDAGTAGYGFQLTTLPALGIDAPVVT